MARLTINCEECLIGFDVTFNPAPGLEVIRRIVCPNCGTEHAVTVRVDVEMEERKKVA